MHWDTLLQDIRYTLRRLRHDTGFALAAVLIIGLGVGSNTAIFSIVDAVLLRPLPFPNPVRLVRLVDNLPGASLHDVGMSVPELSDLQPQTWGLNRLGCSA